MLRILSRAVLNSLGVLLSLQFIMRPSRECFAFSPVLC